jgi:Mrp family chromosome partitioning ATPase
MGRAEIMASAATPTVPTGFRPPLYALLGALAAFVAAAAVAFLLEYLDDTVRDMRDLKGLGVRILGSIRRRRGEQVGDSRFLSLVAAPRSDDASSFRNLRATLDLPTRGPLARSLLVTSSPLSPGKGRVAANLALAYAETGRHVVLMDADMQAPEVHRIFGLTNVRGFARLLAYPAGFGDALAGESPHPNLRIVAAGVPGDDLSLGISEGRLREILDVTLRECDIVIIDGPALSDALHPVLALATVVDRTILVATSGRSHGRALRLAVDNLTMARPDSVDVVLYGASSGHDAIDLPRPETVSYDPWFR